MIATAVAGTAGVLLFAAFVLCIVANFSVNKQFRSQVPKVSLGIFSVSCILFVVAIWAYALGIGA